MPVLLLSPGASSPGGGAANCLVGLDHSRDVLSSWGGGGVLRRAARFGADITSFQPFGPSLQGGGGGGG